MPSDSSILRKMWNHLNGVQRTAFAIDRRRPVLGRRLRETIRGLDVDPGGNRHKHILNRPGVDGFSTSHTYGRLSSRLLAGILSVMGELLEPWPNPENKLWDTGDRPVCAGVRTSSWENNQRTAYFNGDQIHAAKKGMNILDRIPVSHMAQMQNMFDFPPAPKLDSVAGRLDPKEGERERASRRGSILWKGAVLELPRAADVSRSPDARPPSRALRHRTRRRTDQDFHASRYQGQPAVPSRRASADARGHGRVLQLGPGDQPDARGEARPGDVHATVVISLARA
jgi:hypothetical protein